MTRRMSCSLTIEAVKAHTKTVTRRHVDTWRDLQIGDRLTLIEKGMGLPKGAKQVVLAEVEIVDVQVEELWRAVNELDLEGFPEMSGVEFMVMWSFTHGYGPNAWSDTPCRRIEWRYL